MYADQVWLDNLTLVTLLTINSFSYKYGLYAFNELIVTIQRSYVVAFS